jgi:hypothetical protein
VALVAAALVGACSPGGGSGEGRPPAETEPGPPPEETEETAAPDDEDDREVSESPMPEPPGDVEPFEDTAELASALRTAERALADADTPADHFSGWALVHQQAYRDLADRPEWREQARAAVPEELHDAHDHTLHAVTQLLELTQPQEELPDWRIEPPPPVDDLREHYVAAEAEFDVPWEVLAAIHLVETRFGRIHGDSHAGAQGPMQFMPPTWEAYGEGDVHDPRDAIMAAGRYLAASGAPDDLEGAVFAYNRSDRYVEAVLAHAAAMAAHDHYLDAYHGWRVYYRTVDGDVRLDEGPVG